MNKMVLVPHAKYEQLLKKSEKPSLSEAQSQTDLLPEPVPLSRQQQQQQQQQTQEEKEKTKLEPVITPRTLELSATAPSKPPGIRHRKQQQGKGSKKTTNKDNPKKPKEEVNKFQYKDIVNSWIHF